LAKDHQLVIAPTRDTAVSRADPQTAMAVHEERVDLVSGERDFFASELGVIAPQSRARPEPHLAGLIFGDGED